MKKYILLFIILGALSPRITQAQIIDLDKVDLFDLIGKVVKVDKGFAPKFYLGNTPIEKVEKVAEILGLKKNQDVNKLFKTFRTGRTIYKIAAYAGGAVAVYGIAKKLENSAGNDDYKAALYSGVGSVASGLIVKMLTKGAAYEAVDLFNGIAVKTIKDIFSFGPASETLGVGLYIKL